MTHQVAISILALFVALLTVADSFARTWTDREGRTVEAEFIAFEDGKVKLRRKSDDKVFDVPLQRLSDADQAFVQALGKAATKTEAPTLTTEPPTNTTQEDKTAARSTPTSQSPASWAEHMASVFDRRRWLDKVTARDTGGHYAAMKAWGEVLGKKTEEEVPILDKMLFAGRYDPIWGEDKMLEDELQLRVSRAELLPKEAIAKWKKQLEIVQEEEVADFWVIGFMADIPQLFTKDGFADEQSATFLARLKSLPNKLLAEFAELQSVGKAQAAVYVIRNDEFFSEQGFDERTFVEALNLLKAKLSERKE